MLRKKYIFANREDQIHKFPKQHISFSFKFYHYKRRLGSVNNF